MAELTVVVAAQGAAEQLRRCLTALAGQTPIRPIEVLVVDGSGHLDRAQFNREFPAARLLSPRAPQNVPALWTQGILAASGEVVALTIENCVPAPDWAEKMLAEQAGSTCAAIGGAVEMGPEGSVADWAIYFSRYSAYMPPFAARLAEDLPADNCSYRRSTLREVESLAREGFWETFIHQEMRAHGQQLRSTAAPIVVFSGGIAARRFLLRRLAHGRYFAARRGRTFTAAQRWLRAIAFPLVAAMLFVRITERVWRNGRHRIRFVAAAPLVCAFLIAWAAGEALGYLDPRWAKAPPVD